MLTKLLISLLLALLAAGADEADAQTVGQRFLRHPSGVVLRLEDVPCSLPPVLAALPERVHHLFRDGSASGPGFALRLCWTDTLPNGTKVEGRVFAADGKSGGAWIDLDDFTEDPGA